MANSLKVLRNREVLETLNCSFRALLSVTYNNQQQKKGTQCHLHIHKSLKLLDVRRLFNCFIYSLIMNT
jgi:hypothetical protein